jgi:hypothetical protein
MIFGATPLHYAVRQADKGLATYLIGIGADSNIWDGWGETPLRIVLEN